MKTPKAILVLLVLLPALLPATGGRSLAFHEGGAGECEGCHTMHNSEGGFAVASNGRPAGMGNRYLLKGGDSSSTCLNCHEKAGDVGPTSYHVSTPGSEMPFGVPPKQLGPGGDFGWLRKSYTWIPAFGSTLSNSEGDRHGHNVVAGDYGYLQDALKMTAPGGSYPAASLSCVACHDPHGRYRRDQDGSIAVTGKPIRGSGSYATGAEPDAAMAVGAYRLLGGNGYYPKSLGPAFSFINGPPAAVAPADYNRSESTTATRVAYGQGMSEWCRNCHPNIHRDGSGGGLVHPAGTEAPLGGVMVDYYNRYIKTGDLSGVEATSWLSLVPFEAGTNNYALLRNIVTATPTKGPSTADGTPRVMCLTCHRAHASGWDGATRWNTKTPYVTYSGKYSQEGEAYQPYGQGRSEMEALRAYYDRPASLFSPEQAALCTKCHTSVP